VIELKAQSWLSSGGAVKRRILTVSLALECECFVEEERCLDIVATAHAWSCTRSGRNEFESGGGTRPARFVVPSTFLVLRVLQGMSF